MINQLLRLSQNRTRNPNYLKISVKNHNQTKTTFAQLLQERVTLRYLSPNLVIKLLAHLRPSNRKRSLKIRVHHLLISNMMLFNNEMQTNDRKVVILKVLLLYISHKIIQLLKSTKHKRLLNLVRIDKIKKCIIATIHRSQKINITLKNYNQLHLLLQLL